MKLPWRPEPAFYEVQACIPPVSIEQRCTMQGDVLAIRIVDADDPTRLLGYSLVRAGDIDLAYGIATVVLSRDEYRTLYLNYDLQHDGNEVDLRHVRGQMYELVFKLHQYPLDYRVWWRRHNNINDSYVRWVIQYTALSFGLVVLGAGYMALFGSIPWSVLTPMCLVVAVIGIAIISIWRIDLKENGRAPNKWEEDSGNDADPVQYP